MRAMQDWIKELMGLYDQDCPESPALVSEEIRDFRVRLVNEETDETRDALKAGDLKETADGLADMLVVVYGTHNAYGLDAEHKYRGLLPDYPPRMMGYPDRDGLIEMIERSLERFNVALGLNNDLGEIKLACDLLVQNAHYVAIALGIDIMPVFMEVHWSNKTKFGEDGKPIKDAGGKVIKGPNYQKPDIAGVLERQAKYYIHSR